MEKGYFDCGVRGLSPQHQSCDATIKRLVYHTFRGLRHMGPMDVPTFVTSEPIALHCVPIDSAPVAHQHLLDWI